MKTKSVKINEGLVFDGRLFVTPNARARYISTLRRDRPRWLKENPDKWISLRDIQEQGGQLAPPVENENNVGAAPAGPNGEPSSRDVGKDGDDEDDVALVDFPGVDRSPPCELTSLPTPVKTNVPNGSTKAEPLAHPQAAMSEAKGPQIK